MVQTEQNPHLELVRAFSRLDKIHQAFEGAASELERVRAAPLCVEKCGLCCHTPYVWDIEARNIVSSILGNGNLSRILSLSEGWVLDRPAQLTIYERPSPPTKEFFNKLMPEFNWLMSSVSCPFLDGDKRCSIYTFRPIHCRSYGVTKVPDKDCRRPVGAGENASSSGQIIMAYYGGSGSQILERKLSEFILRLRNPAWRVCWPLPTLLFSLGEPEKFNKYRDSNQIPTAKLMTSNIPPMTLWQHQLESAWKRGG